MQTYQKIALLQRLESLTPADRETVEALIDRLLATRDELRPDDRDPAQYRNGHNAIGENPNTIADPEEPPARAQRAGL